MGKKSEKRKIRMDQIDAYGNFWSADQKKKHSITGTSENGKCNQKQLQKKNNEIRCKKGR